MTDSNDDPHLRLIKEAYAPEHFRDQAHRIVDLLADHLGQAQTETNRPVIPWQAPQHAVERWPIDDQPKDIETLFQKVLDQSIHLQNPRFLGHQINPVAPTAAIAGLLVDLLNNGMGVYEMGIAGTAIEHSITQALAKRFSMGASAGGFFTSGGTLGNLTALLTARSAYYAKHQSSSDNTETKDAAASSRPLCILTSEASHYCIQRAAHVMGFGSDGVVEVECDADFRMRPDALAHSFQQVQASGRDVIAVVGSACTTSTGAFDALVPIAHFCRKRDVWFHVDGAHGAATVFSKKYRHLVDGIGLADSVVMDFHKLMMTPAITTAVVYQRWKDGLQTFATQAEYLWSKQRDEGDCYNMAKRTFECTKSMMAFKVYALWTLHGESLFDANVTRLFDLTQRFAELIQTHTSFEVAHRPMANIICFRHLFPNRESDRVSQLNKLLRQNLIEQGDFYIVQTELNGEAWLRCTVTNPLTTEQQLVDLLDRLDEIAQTMDCSKGFGDLR